MCFLYPPPPPLKKKIYKNNKEEETTIIQSLELSDLEFSSLLVQVGHVTLDVQQLVVIILRLHHLAHSIKINVDTVVIHSLCLVKGVLKRRGTTGVC